MRLVRTEAREFVEFLVPAGSVQAYHIYFPDPWPKKRHHKRRIVQAEFLHLAATKLAVGGTILIATDWENYADHIDDLVTASTDFPIAERYIHNGSHDSLDREQTKFERRGLREGHRIRDWRLVRI